MLLLDADEEPVQEPSDERDCAADAADSEDGGAEDATAENGSVARKSACAQSCAN